MPVQSNIIASAADRSFRAEIVRTWRTAAVYGIDGLTVVNETDRPGTVFVIHLDTRAVIATVRAAPRTSQPYSVPSSINQATREKYTIACQWPSS